MMPPLDHKLKREEVTWGSYGKDGKGPIVRRLVKDLSDTHLINIINHIQENHAYYSFSTMQLMRDEIVYRSVHNIKVKDYDTPKRNRRKVSRKNTNS